MSDKITLKCVDFRPVCKGSLRGFASISIAEMRMTFSDVAVHVHEESGRAWASPPARPRIGKDGQAITDDRGKVAYTPIVSFDSLNVRNGFSDAVIRAVLDRYPDALECREAVA